MPEHKWTDVRGWGGALPGTEQCDYCNRVASPTDPKRYELMASECLARRMTSHHPRNDETTESEGNR